jgi:hypothetical protein
MSSEVQTEAPNKMDFYHFFKDMLNKLITAKEINLKD